MHGAPIPDTGTYDANNINVAERKRGALRTNAHKHGEKTQHMDTRSAARTFRHENGKGTRRKTIKFRSEHRPVANAKHAPESCRKNDNNSGRNMDHMPGQNPGRDTPG